MTLVAYISLFLSAIVGGLLGLYLQKSDSNRVLRWILPFSGAFLLGISVLHMLPEAYAGLEGSHRIGLFILLGYLIQILLEFLSKGIEHGHVHYHDHGNSSMIFGIMLGLCLHAFVEGMPMEGLLGGHAGHDHRFIKQPYLLGIIFHKIPAAIALSMILFQYKASRFQVFIYLLIFASMSPLGSYIFSLFDVSEVIRKSILGLAIGTILHVATVIIFEMDGNLHHSISIKKVMALLFGFLLSFISII